MAMNRRNRLANTLLIPLCTALLAACTIEPLQPDKPVEVVVNAPEWVNEGSKMVVIDKDTMVFRGVASISLQGDMGLQQSIVDDKAIAETGKVLGKYLENVSNSYLTSIKYDEEVDLDALQGRQLDQERALEKKAAKRVKENITNQIDTSIKQQFKEDMPQQFKEDVYRKVKETSSRQIRDSVAYQVEFASSLQVEIDRQIKAAVSGQLRRTTGTNVQGAKVVENWRDPRTNTMWSMAQLDLKHVKSTLAESKDMNADLKEYFQDNAETLFENMLKKRDEGFYLFNFGERRE